MIAFAPLQGVIPTLMANSTNMLSMSRFSKEIEQEDVVYAFLPCKNSAAEASPNIQLK